MRRFALLFLACTGALIAAEPAAYGVKDFKNLIGMKGFSDSLLQMHFKLYEGYVKNTNELIGKLKALSDQGQSASLEYGALKRRLGWEFDGMRLHELYFGNLGGNGVLDKSKPLYAALGAQFGNFEGWKKDFIATGLMRGIGWAVLFLDPMEGKLINTWINEHDKGHLAEGVPLLIMDVFEHAYMPEYGLDKAKYIQAFFQNINWQSVVERYQVAMGLSQ
jgi:Fe-Mn family superoxide dismutase